MTDTNQIRVYKVTMLDLGTYVTSDINAAMEEVRGVEDDSGWLIESYLMDKTKFDSMKEFQGF